MENEGRGLLSRCCIVSVQGAHLACHRWAPDHGNISERQHTTENRGGGHLPRHLRRRLHCCICWLMPLPLVRG